MEYGCKQLASKVHRTWPRFGDAERTFQGFRPQVPGPKFRQRRYAKVGPLNGNQTRGKKPSLVYKMA